MPAHLQLIKLYDKCYTYADFFPQTGILRRVFSNIIIIPGRNSKAAMGGAGARSAPFCVSKGQKD